MNLAVFGATGGTGRQVVEQALRSGHTVRALIRSPSPTSLPEAVAVICGNALDAPAVGKAVSGADAVVSCLGVKLTATFMRRGRIVGPAMALILEAMRSRGVRRLVAVSTYGAGDSWPRLTWGARMMMGGLLWGELADKNAMEAVVRASDRDWTIVRPVNLKSGPPTGHWLVEPSHKVGLGDWIARGDVAAAVLQIIADQSFSRRPVLLAAQQDRPLDLRRRG